MHSFALAPGAARAMDSEGGVAVQPRLVLPSQEAFMQRPELLMSEPEPLHIRVVQSPIFQGSVGIVAVGAAGGVVYQQMQKRQTESMRSMLSSQAGIDIDASILDEVLLRSRTLRGRRVCALSQALFHLYLFSSCMMPCCSGRKGYVFWVCVDVCV